MLFVYLESLNPFLNSSANKHSLGTILINCLMNDTV